MKVTNIKKKISRFSKTQKIFIFHHMGLGDFISCNAIIRKFCKQKKEIFLFCKINLLKNIKFMYRDLKNLTIIKIKDENDIDNFLKSINLEKGIIKLLSWALTIFIKLFRTNSKTKTSLLIWFFINNLIFLILIDLKRRIGKEILRMRKEFIKNSIQKMKNIFLFTMILTEI